MKRIILYALSVFLIYSELLAQQTAKTLAVPGKTTIGFYEFRPAGYDPNATKKYPLIIFLHGWDERGNGTTQLPRVLLHGIPKLINGGNPMTFTIPNTTQQESFLVLSPQLPGFEGGWANAYIDAILNHAQNTLNVDPDRIYLTGLSMGGAGTLTYPSTSLAHAQKFAAIAPIATPQWYVDSLLCPSIGVANIGVWGFTNDQDQIGAWGTYHACEVLKTCNTKVKRTMYPSSSHDAWTKAYDAGNTIQSPNIYEWFLTNVRSSNIALSANAATDQTITSPSSQVSLNGTNSTPPTGGSITNYAWTHISGPSGFTIQSPNAAVTSVTGLTQGTHVFRLTVTDNSNATAVDDVTIIVNSPPVANGGNDQTITLPTSQITLSGSASSDPDGTLTHYGWIKVSGPGTPIIGSPSSSSTTVSGLTAGSYVFRLTVTDNSGATASDDVAVTVNPAAPSESGDCAAMSFDGINDWVNIPDINFTGDFTFETWVKIDQVATEQFLVLGQEGPGQNINFYQNKFRLYSPDPGFWDVIIATTPNQPGVWTHYAITRSGNTVSLYINGAPNATSTGWTAPFKPKAIGREVGYLKGKLDDMRFWTVARTTAEISANYNKSVSTPATGLYAYYKFNEAAGDQEVIDETGNYHATRGSNLTVEASDPTRITTDLPPITNDCQVSSATCAAMSFDGINDWVNIPDINLTGDFTFETWVKIDQVATEQFLVLGQEGPGQNINFYQNKFRLYSPDPGFWDVIIATTPNQPGVWTHYAITRSGSTVSLYINGAPNATTTGWTAPFKPKAIGREVGYLKGKLDDMRFWTVARTAAEISANYNKSVSASVTGLYAYYKFNETESDQQVTDATGNYHASRGSNTTAESSDPTRITTDLAPLTDDCQPLGRSSLRGDLVETTSAGISFKIYPNPVIDKTNVWITVDNSAMYSITVSDLSGRICYTKNVFINSNAGQNFILKLPEHAGLYIIKVRGGNQTKTEKIFKAR